MRFARRSPTPVDVAPSGEAPDAYEVLDVSEDASAVEVRAAWSAQVTTLDPSQDGERMRALNTAAETLLDGDRRAALDASRAAERYAASEATSTSDDDDRTGDEPTVAAEGSSGRRRPRLLGTAAGLVALVLLSVAATIAVVAAVVLGERARDAEALEETWQVAPATAERAAEAVLGYDYRELEADGRAARQWLTPAYQREYDTQLDALSGPAEQQQVVVDAEVFSSGVLSASRSEASVLLFVDQTRALEGTEEPPVANRVRFDMVLRDGRWLVDDIVTLDDF